MPRPSEPGVRVVTPGGSAFQPCPPVAERVRETIGRLVLVVPVGEWSYDPRGET